MLANDSELEATLSRIQWCVDQLRQWRRTETVPANYASAASGFIAEIDRLQQKVREYFASPPIELQVEEADPKVLPHNTSKLRAQTGEAGPVLIRASFIEHDISGTPAELRAVAAALESLKAGESRYFPAIAGADPAPYQTALEGLEVIASGGSIRASRVGHRLRVTGSPDALAGFASFFHVEDGTPSGHHCHHEWWEGNEFIADDSLPLVISVR